MTIGLVLCCGLLLGLPACGKKKGGGATGNAGKFVGKWGLDADKIIANNADFKKMTDDQKKKMKEMFGKMTLTVTKDKITMEGMGKKETDTYKVLEDKGKKLTIESTDEKGKKEKLTLIFTSDSAMHGTKEDMTMYFKRK